MSFHKSHFEQKRTRWDKRFDGFIDWLESGYVENDKSVFTYRDVTFVIDLIKHYQRGKKENDISIESGAYYTPFTDSLAFRRWEEE